MPACGVMLALVKRIPSPANRHPVAIGIRGPHAATQRPASSEDATMPTARGMKFKARPNGDLDPTTWRYRATMKKMAKVPKYTVKAMMLDEAKAARLK